MVISTACSLDQCILLVVKGGSREVFVRVERDDIKTHQLSKHGYGENILPTFSFLFLHYVWSFPAASAVHSGVHIFVPDFCYFEVCGTTFCFPSALEVCLSQLCGNVLKSYSSP